MAHSISEAKQPSLPCRTHIAQKLQAELFDKIIAFHTYVIRKRKDHQFLLSEIANMDKNLMQFGMVESGAYNARGEKKHHCKTVITKSRTLPLF